MRIVAISDTHGLHESLAIPDGDVLVHAGDVTSRGAAEELVAFNKYLGMLPHRYKLVIAGNHDWCFEQHPKLCARLLTNTIYLQDTAITIEGLKFYGSPWQPWFYDWAFNLPRGGPIREKWLLIPGDTNVLITHGPPHGFGDQTFDLRHAGCEDLLEIVGQIAPRAHIFGHIHEAAGVSSNGRTTFINASSCDLNYQPVNQPVVFEYQP
jgi:Icc-related predicted phosphoesterase